MLFIQIRYYMTLEKNQSLYYCDDVERGLATQTCLSGSFPGYPAIGEAKLEPQWWKDDNHKRWARNTKTRR